MPSQLVTGTPVVRLSSNSRLLVTFSLLEPNSKLETFCILQYWNSEQLQRNGIDHSTIEAAPFPILLRSNVTITVWDHRYNKLEWATGSMHYMGLGVINEVRPCLVLGPVK